MPQVICSFSDAFLMKIKTKSTYFLAVDNHVSIRISQLGQADRDRQTERETQREEREQKIDYEYIQTEEGERKKEGEKNDVDMFFSVEEKRRKFS